MFTTRVNVTGLAVYLHKIGDNFIRWYILMLALSFFTQDQKGNHTYILDTISFYISTYRHTYL